MVEVIVSRKRLRDCKVTEICLAVLSDQDVVLDAFENQRAGSLDPLFCLPG